MRVPGPRPPRRRRYEGGFGYRNPVAAVAIGLVVMGILTAVEIDRTIGARHTVRHGWGQGVLIGLAIAVVLLLVLVVFLRLKNRKVRRTATTWLLIFLVASFAVAAIGTLPPRYSTGSYVITSHAGALELGYTCAMCLLIDVLVVVAGYRILRARRSADGAKPTSLVP
jgi:heme A synthase